MTEQRILASSAVMAAGTVVSRASGYIRATLLVVALGSGLRGDLFAIANTLPNMVYILLAGGIFNAVLVPQLVRRIKDDADGGDAYASRVITLSALFLGAVTVLLVLVAPLVLRIYLADGYLDPDRAAHLESIIDLTRWCLPQVFFYGMYVLVGQVLNARGSFGPMMWAPIANNLLSVLMLVVYLVLHGATGRGPERADALGTGPEVLLGVGSTLGIVVQFLVLVPYLRASGFTYRPRFDFRDPELKRTLSLGIWTVLFVVATQTAYLVVVKLASGGAVDDGTGYLVYSNSLLIMMVPHAIVTVSLATAILPRLSSYAHDGRLADLGSTVGSTLRTSLALVLPFAVLLPITAGDVAGFAFGWASAEEAATFAPTLAVFGPALVFFTVHYFMLRGFYAMEMTRLVFFIQLAVSLTNIAVATVLVPRGSPEDTAPLLVVAYLASYAVGAVASYVLLRRTVGGLETPQLVRFLVRMAVVLTAAGAAAWLVELSMAGLGEYPGPLGSLLRGGLSAAAGMLVVLLGARLLRVREVTGLVDTVAARLRRT
ncbi:murein biosynthesis integral membrane protein MurJ [Nocardioides ganghwensis]|jgi:putative peptidoglycan lipid II flippase|uniref:Murein biosynthesis integral membrane protein MurJ n=1 Tax=Nocardioides ganghwensis TaxID=252230 RepID=A0A4V1RMA9_9ACTN|nr:murein biosynthesis integral membrane protein MurJ [Nocardioides ganghwensis]MBD3947414.1 murein biosynthesis integral membrane protein MurJ [Nocardioides ganghwensis]RYC00351.1 murein biosynthesis integral membrane protein MurJ [Nocardioides ganghwensis]